MQNAAQIEFWNGDTGRNWVTHDALMEAMLAPIGERILDALTPGPQSRGLDIGCGCGHPTVSLAKRIGASGSVLGIDISAPMLKVARSLAQTAGTDHAAIEFLEADAQSHSFDGQPFDLVFSRFGVMFFEDPVAAFSNIHSAMAPAGQLAFGCWQPRAVNPFMTLPAVAAMELLPPPPALPPRAPGPFAFEEPEYVEGILNTAGFSEIDIVGLSQPLVFGRGLSLRDIVERLVEIGPIAQMVRDAPEALQQPVREKVIAALAPFYGKNSGMVLDGQIWQVTAIA